MRPGSRTRSSDPSSAIPRECEHGSASRSRTTPSPRSCCSTRCTRRSTTRSGRSWPSGARDPRPRRNRHGRRTRPSAAREHLQPGAPARRAANQCGGALRRGPAHVHRPLRCLTNGRQAPGSAGRVAARGELEEAIRQGHERFDYVVISMALDPRCARSSNGTGSRCSDGTRSGSDGSIFYVVAGLRVSRAGADLVHTVGPTPVVPNRVDLNTVTFCHAAYDEATAADAAQGDLGSGGGSASAWPWHWNAGGSGVASGRLRASRPTPQPTSATTTPTAW